MDLVKQAERFEQMGDLEAAIDQYRTYIGLTKQPDVAIYYKTGMLLLQFCAETFKQEFYEEGISLLTKSYNMGYSDKRGLYNLLFEVVCQPNQEKLVINYQKNRRIGAEKYKDMQWPLFEKLPILLFPLREDVFVMYDKKSDCFLDGNFVKLEYGPYIISMTHSDVSEKWFGYLCDKVEKEERAKVLSKNINDALRAKTVQETLLQEIEKFHALMPFSEKYERMLARYYCIAGNYRRAQKCVEQGLKKRPLHMELHELAAPIYFRLGMYDKAVVSFLFMATKGEIKEFFESDPYQFPGELLEKIRSCIACAGKKSVDAQQRVLKAMSFSMRHARDFVTGKEFYLNKMGQVELKTVFLLGQIIERTVPDLKYFCGLYAEYSRAGTYAAQTDLIVQGGRLALAYRKTYDALEVEQIARDYIYEGTQYPCLIPFMATDYTQNLSVSYKGKTYDESFGKLECNFLRISAPVQFHSEKEFAFGRAIPLQHDSKRKKLVLSILVDALSFVKIQENDFVLMPHVKRFFKKGVIFAKNYAPAEWTLSSEAAIQAGLYQDRTQIFHPKAFVQMDESYFTITQHMRRKGYYCMLLEGTLAPRLCNTYRGFHRVIGDESYSADHLVADAQKHIQALHETDLFMHLHLMDAHIHGQPISLEQRVNLEPEEYFGLSLRESKSVWTVSTLANVRHYEEKVKQIDRVLGNLFRYLEQMYTEDEYVVVLHSDHGISIIGDEPYLFKKGMANAAFMACGSGVPSCGLVEQEVTNTIDLYAVLAHLCDCEIADGLDCRLPKAFGGQGREYTISNCLYPGQAYQMCIRTLQHAFFLTTKGMVTLDGRVNMNEFNYQLFAGNNGKAPIQDSKIAARFIEIALQHTERIHDVNA